MNSLFQDLRFGARMLSKNFGFTVVAIFAIALGIGANTALFSVVNTVLLRPLPYEESERLVAIYETNARTPDGRNAISYPNFFDWRARNQTLENLAVHREAVFSMTGEGDPVQLSGHVVSAELFDLLHVKPLIGRAFQRADEKVGGATSNRAAVISHSFWQRQFAGDASVIGRSILLDRKPFEIVGVMPAGFQFPIQAAPVDIWVTSALDSEATRTASALTERRGFRLLDGIARLADGVTLEQAQAEMDAIAAALEAEHPDNNTGNGIRLLALHDNLVSDYRAALWILFGAVGCVLLIACANVANLMLARTTARYKEIAVRVALGASRWRLVRQLLTESLLLSLAGGALGLLLAWWGIELLLTLVPEDLPRLAEISIDRRVLGFTFLLSLATGVGFGVIPAVSGSKSDLHDAMKEGARGNSGGRRARLRGALVVAEVALALVLLVGAGLFGQTFLQLQRVNLGFDSANLLTARVQLPDDLYPEPQQKVAFYQQLFERLQTLPGVTSVSGVAPLPISGMNASGTFQFAGRVATPGEEPRTAYRWANLDYFKTMKIAFVEGRDFTAQDHLQAPPVVIINEAFAHQHFPDEEPLGKRLTLPFAIGDANDTSVEIIGIVKDTRHRTTLSREVEPEMYLSYAQLPFLPYLSLVMRTDGEPRSLANAAQGELWALNKELSLYDVKPMSQYLGNAVAQPRFAALLFGIFAAVALLLAAVGLYGVMVYTVTQRTHEIGIRLALGAQTSDVLKMVVRQGMTLAVVGIALGLVAAYWGASVATQLLADLLYGVTTTDTVTFVVVALVLAIVALAACFVPARRATKVDPMVALRYE